MRIIELAFSLAVTIGGLIAAALFSTKALPTLATGVIAIGLLTSISIIIVRTSQASLLPRLTILLYSLPFATTIGFLFNDQYIWWIGRLAADPFLRSYETNQTMIYVGLIGLMGLVAGIFWAQVLLKKSVSVSSSSPRYLGLPIFSILLALVVSLSWLSAPAKDIFEAAYASEGLGGVAANIGFSSSFLMSYILAIILWIDLENTTRRRLSRIKFVLLLSAVIFIVFYINLLRGDRECIGLIAGMACMYITSLNRARISDRFRSAMNILRQKKKRIAMIAVSVLFSFSLLGTYRFTLSDRSSSSEPFEETIVSSLKYNTWSGVLLTNLANAAEYRESQKELLLGSTYVHYLQSLPPGIVATFLNYTRPMDGRDNPCVWYAGPAGGGVHIAVVPFRNFGIYGLFFIMFLYGVLIGVLDRRNSRYYFWWRVMYGSLVTCSFFWFWYGEMNLIRAVMGAILFGSIYQSLLRVSLISSKKSDIPAKPLLAKEPQCASV